MNKHKSAQFQQKIREANAFQLQMKQKLEALVSENDTETSKHGMWSQLSVTDSGLNAFIISEFQVTPKAEKNKTIAWAQVESANKGESFAKEGRESLRRSR